MNQQANNIRKRSTSRDLDQTIQQACQDLIDSDQEVTAREVARRVGVAPSSITRDPTRKEIIKNAKSKQSELRAWRKRQAKQSRDRDAESLTEKDLRITELEQRIDLLTASHKAMVLAIGEFGGMAGWQRFFPHWQQVEELLRDMGAMPIAQIKQLGNRTDRGDPPIKNT